ncbi:MAG: M28 family peptidase [Myxococcales bacterium]|nr:M28 family peptidase [Myxococcales bacterium]
MRSPLLVPGGIALLLLTLATKAAFACDATSAAGLASCIDEAKYAETLKALAAAPRSMDTPGLADARARCAAALKASGFQLMAGEGVTDEGLAVVNVVGYRPGTVPTRPAVVIGAHMDTVRDCNGANDNASGVAAVLEMARVLGRAKHEADLYVACWDGEERGHAGSQVAVAAAQKKQIAIEVNINFEQIGNRQTEPQTQAPPPAWFSAALPEAAKAMAETELRGDFAMFIWDAGVKMNVWDQMVSVSKVRLLKGVVPRQPDGKMGEVSGGLLMSDHASFWKADYPAVYITDTGPFRKSGFHCMLRPDDAQFIDTAFATGIVRAATVLAADRLGLLP